MCHNSEEKCMVAICKFSQLKCTFYSNVKLISVYWIKSPSPLWLWDSQTWKCPICWLLCDSLSPSRALISETAVMNSSVVTTDLKQGCNLCVINSTYISQRLALCSLEWCQVRCSSGQRTQITQQRTPSALVHHHNCKTFNHSEPCWSPRADAVSVSRWPVGALQRFIVSSTCGPSVLTYKKFIGIIGISPCPLTHIGCWKRPHASQAIGYCANKF